MYLHRAQLLFKYYRDKPSRIGIKYTYEFQALKPYEELMRNYAGQTFSLKLEPKNNQIILTITSNECGESIVYKDLIYKPEQLKQFMQMGRRVLPLEFVHIYSEANTLLIAKPFKQSTFFQVSHYEVVGINAFY